MNALTVMADRWLPFTSLNRRRGPRRGPAWRVGSRVEVLGPWSIRTGPGTITGNGRRDNVFVTLDSGHDVLVGRQWCRTLSTSQGATS